MHYGVFLRAVDALTPVSVKEVKKRVGEPQKTFDDVGAEVLLVKGEKLENDASDVVARLLQTELGLRTAFVELEALDQVDLQGVKLIYFPGGEMASIRLPDLVTPMGTRLGSSGILAMGPQNSPGLRR